MCSVNVIGITGFGVVSGCVFDDGTSKEEPKDEPGIQSEVLYLVGSCNAVGNPRPTYP